MSEIPRDLDVALRQSEITADIQVAGIPDLQVFLTKKMKLLSSPDWIKLCGGEEVPLLVYLQTVARVNGVTLERCIVNELLTQGYTLEELVVEIASTEGIKWGKAVWYKEHSSYPAVVEKMFGNAKPNFLHALLHTENAGDQHFCLYSTQVSLSGGVLFHKTLIYHRAIFSQPPPVAPVE